MNRMDELSGCPLYRRLAPRKWLPGVVGAVCGIGVLCLAAAGVAEAYDEYFAPDAAADWQVLVQILLGTLVPAVAMAWGAFGAVREVREYNARQMQQLSRIDAMQFFALQEEVESAELLYGSFYLLREFVYAPKARVLVRYEEIAAWNNSGRKGFRTSAVITEYDGAMHYIGIRKDKEYLKEYDRFRDILDSYRQQAERNHSIKNENRREYL